MIEILFKGKIQSTDNWIDGLPHTIYKGAIDSIQCIKTGKIEYIKTDTLCQFTGLLDKNGKKIFEGDKFEDEEGYIAIEYDVNKTAFVTVLYGYRIYLNEGSGEEFEKDISEIDRNFIDVKDLCTDEIIGNIHD